MRVPQSIPTLLEINSVHTQRRRHEEEEGHETNFI